MKKRDNHNGKDGVRLHDLCSCCGGKVPFSGKIEYNHAFCSLKCKNRFLNDAQTTTRRRGAGSAPFSDLNRTHVNRVNREHLRTYSAKRLKKTMYLFSSIFVVIFLFHMISSHFALSSINPGKDTVQIDRRELRQITQRIKILPFKGDDKPGAAERISSTMPENPAIKEALPAEKPGPANISQVWNAGKNISITFDGDTNASSARQILEVLRENRIKTTFFLTGRFIGRYRDLTRRIAEEGHEVGNHTFTHPHLTTYGINRKPALRPGITSNTLKAELDKTARLFKEVTGRDISPLWRAPYGEINNDILEWASESGYRHIAWTYHKRTRQSMDSLDWVADKNSSLYLTTGEIKERLTSFLDSEGRANGGIVLMHLGTERTNDILHERLDDIINSVTARGYGLVPVSRLIDLGRKS